MGLDCIPHEYPCKVQGTAVMPDGKIDCDLTIAAGGCPWKRAVEHSNRGQSVLGMMGTYCWYRGKVGEHMLQELEVAGYDDWPAGGFYGAGADNDPDLTPEHCDELGTWMKEHVEVYASIVPDDVRKEEVDRYRYAAWWLKWVGEEAGGADAWY